MIIMNIANIRTQIKQVHKICGLDFRHIWMIKQKSKRMNEIDERINNNKYINEINKGTNK